MRFRELIEGIMRNYEGKAKIDAIYLYSECPKSGRPDFGVFETCPVAKHVRLPNMSGFRNPDTNVRFLNVRIQTIKASGYRTFESQSTERLITRHKCPDFRHFKPKTGSKPVPNRFRTCLEPVLGLKPVPNV